MANNQTDWRALCDELLTCMDQDAALVALTKTAEGDPLDNPWRQTIRERARAALTLPEPKATITEPRGCPTPGACSCPTAPYVPPELIRALELAKAALADIGDADQANADIERKLQEAADEELEACCEVLHQHDRAYLLPSQLRAARRPKPQSLKEEELQKSTSMMINCHWDGPPPSPHASVNDWFEQEGSKGVLYGLRISALPSRGGNRSPKPPSLKEQALGELDAAILRGDCFSTSPARHIIRRALKSIPDPS